MKGDNLLKSQISTSIIDTNMLVGQSGERENFLSTETRRSLPDGFSQYINRQLVIDSLPSLQQLGDFTA